MPYFSKQLLSLQHTPGSSTPPKYMWEIGVLQCQIHATVLHHGCQTRQAQFPCAWFLPLRNATHKVRNCINKCSAHSLVTAHSYFHLETEENRFFDDWTESPPNQNSSLNCAPMVCAQRLGSTFLQSPPEAPAAFPSLSCSKGDRDVSSGEWAHEWQGN